MVLAIQHYCLLSLAWMKQRCTSKYQENIESSSLQYETRLCDPQTTLPTTVLFEGTTPLPSYHQSTSAVLPLNAEAKMESLSP